MPHLICDWEVGDTHSESLPGTGYWAQYNPCSWWGYIVLK